MNGRRGILLILFMAAVTTAGSQEKWNLEQCIDFAVENNLEIKSERIATEVNHEILQQSKRNRLPYVDANTSYNINFGKSVDPNTNDVTYSSFGSNNYMVAASVSLFEGFIRNNQIDYYRFIYHAGLAKEETIKTEIAFLVMNAFYQVLYYKGLLDIVEEQKELSELNLDKVKREAEVGIGARTDVLEIEARLAEEELLLIQTSNYLKASMLDLKRAMNFPPDQDIELQNPEEETLISSAVYENADSVFSMALKHLPSVEARYQELKAVEKTVAVAKGQLSPTIRLNGGYYTGYYETRTDADGNPISFRDQFTNNASQMIGATLSVPVFNKWKTRSDIKLSKLDLEAKMVELQDYKNQLYYEIEAYCQDLSAVSAEYLQAQKQTASNELAFEVSEKKKEQGLINVLDFYTSKNLLSNAKGELLRTKLQYIVKRKTIDFYMGKPVFGLQVN